MNLALPDTASHPSRLGMGGPCLADAAPQVMATERVLQELQRGVFPL